MRRPSAVPVDRPRTGRARRAALACAVILGLAAAPATAAAAPSKLVLGFSGTGEYVGPDRPALLDRAAAESASIVRVTAGWAGIAPTRPTDAQAVDPNWSGYRWASVDAQVRDLASHGLAPLVLINGAPAWAQESGAPANASAGAWKPDPAALGRFATALARRYAGGTPDPLDPTRALPKATRFQVWNEPNLDKYLAPQWQGGKPFAPTRFRDMVNAAYAGIKAVQPRATVVTAGLAPFGDYGTTSGSRIPPVAFLRSMLCLDGKLRRTCTTTARFDDLSQHLYAVRAPSSPGLNADDVSIPDLGKLTKVLKAARKARTVGPGTPGLWVTEVSYDSSPPDPDGVPTATLKKWVPELLWRAWDQGVGTLLWFQVRDQAPTPSYGATNQSGMYLLDGRRKAYAQSFRFPLLITSRTSKTLRVWLRSPRAGSLKVQVRRGGAWRTAKTVRVSASGVRTLTVPRSRVTAVRAVVAGEASTAWSVR